MPIQMLSLCQGIYGEVRKETGRAEHQMLGMFVLVLMSHGGRGNMVMGSDCAPVDLMAIQDLLSARRFPAMKGKPKLIIVQACSGGECYIIY